MRQWKIAFSLAIVGVIAGVAASFDVGRAAEISCANQWGSTASTITNLNERYPSGRRPAFDTCQAILIVGEIQNGDYEKFAKIVAASHPFLSEVYIWSPGGSVDEAIKIGRLVRKDMLKTQAPFMGYGGSNSQGSLPVIQWASGAGRGISQFLACDGANCYCASACFLIWVAGGSRQGNFIGLHRPSVQSTRFANLPPVQASSLYRQLLKDIGSYLQEMEVPQRYIDAMTDTASNEIRWLTEKEALLMREVPSITEWLATSCGHFTKHELDKMTLLLNQSDGGRRFAHSQDELLYKSLGEKSKTIFGCGYYKMEKGRDAIPDILK